MKTFEYPPRGSVVYLTMKSGAIYQGIFWRYMDIGGGQIQLSDVRCCDRDNKVNVIVSPKRKVNRNFWCSKIEKIENANC